MGVQPEKVKQTKKPVGPEATPTINVGIVPNLNTQEVDNLLAEEEEFYDAIDELEHGIGINKSMLDWANVNFNSSFGDSGEFEGRVSVEKLVNCVDCETNSKTINMQAELLTKLDKQLQDCHNKLKASKKHEKQMEIKLSDAMKIIQKHESVSIEPMVVAIKCRECEYVCETQEELRDHKRTKKAESRAKDPAYGGLLVKGVDGSPNQEGPLLKEDSKCDQCSFESTNRVLLNEHKEKGHSIIKCVTCGDESVDMESFREHGKKHQVQWSKEKFKCDKCSFMGENMIKINDHKEKYHKTEHKCLVCGDTFVNRERFSNHAEIHKYKGQVSYFPGNSAFFNCHECKESFKSHDYMMDHLSQVHLTEAQRQGAGLAKYPSYHEKPLKEWKPPCRNGPQCYYNRQNRCNFYHRQVPQWQQGRPARQSPSSQWQQVPSQWQHHQQGQRDHSAHEPRAQGHKYWSVPPKGVQLVPWCFHGRDCPMGQYCVLRHEDTDFPNLHQQGGN